MASCGALPSVGGCELSKRPCAGSLIMSIGRLINDAPGRPNSAARKPFASTSDSADDEVTSAANLVTGEHRHRVHGLMHLFGVIGAFYRAADGDQRVTF